MKFALPHTVCAFALGLLALSSAQSAVTDDVPVDRIDSISSPRLSLYARDAMDSKLKDVPRESVPVPLTVSETAQDGKFLKVKLDGDTVWVHRKQVNVHEAVSAGCLVAKIAGTDAGSKRGANNGCVR